MKQFLAAIALLCVGCAPSSTTAPTPIQPAPSVPATISLSALPGIGSSAGTVAIVATVTDASGHGVSAMVRFATTAGTMQPENVLADPGGLAQASVVTSSTATITASAGSATGRIDVTPNAPVVIPPQPPSPVPPVVVPVPVPTPSPAPAPPLAQPTISLGPMQATANVSSPLSVSPFLSDGSRIDSWFWDFGDGQSNTVRVSNTSHTWTTAGSYPVLLTATDASGRTASARSTAVVIPAPVAPVPPPPTPPSLSIAIICPVATTKTQACNLASTYGGADVLSSKMTAAAWDWGDGLTSATFPLGLHTYAQAGLYTIFATGTVTTPDGPRTVTTLKTVTIP